MSLSQTTLSIILPKAASLTAIKILIVGVGGIGCQLLKILSKFHFGQIHIIDMDTIEISNLNRQFLFKHQHRGLSKALTACQVIKTINPKLHIFAHHSNIKSMSIDFFKQFDYLLMALDNVQARNYVNKIGVRLNIPIIDAGTLGYKGNSNTIIPKLSKCYACEQKQVVQKVFPVCTIRNRPQKPIHCIVWAKLLFEVFFGSENDDNDLSDLRQFLMGIKQKQGSLEKKILIKLFKTDIQQLKHAKNQSQKQASLLFSKSLNPLTDQQLQPNNNSNNMSIHNFKKFDTVLSLDQNISLFEESFCLLHKQKLNDGFIPFEKDDDNIIHFISSCANLRMHCFSIPQQTFYDIKNMVGNIIPAIASTNSIVSGLQITQLFKLISNNNTPIHSRSYFVQNLNHKILAMKLQPPNPHCKVCVQSSFIIQTNFEKFTMKELVQLIINNYSIVNNQTIPQFSINLGANQLYSSEDPKQTILNFTIYSILSNTKQHPIVQGEFIIQDEDNAQKICSLWMINSKSVEVTLTNSHVLLKKINQANQPQKQQQNNFDDDSSDLVIENNCQDQVEIIEVKKRNNDYQTDKQVEIKKIVKID